MSFIRNSKFITAWYSINIDKMNYRRISFYRSHNLEVPGSSPGWSTKKIKHLQSFCRCFFFYWWPSGDLFKAKLYKSDLLKFHWIAENFYRFLSYCGLDIAKHDAHFKLKTGFSIKYICKPLETKNKPIGRLI